MRTFASQADSMRGHSLGLVVFAATGDEGLDQTRQFLNDLPPLKCPVLVSVRNTSPDALDHLVDGDLIRNANDGARLSEASVWIVPGDRASMIRDGALHLTEPDIGHEDQEPPIGRLFFSLRAEYGSRVCLVVADADLVNSPFLPLLALRGARVLSPLEIAGDTLVEYAPMPVVVDHLANRAGVQLEVAS